MTANTTAPLGREGKRKVLEDVSVARGESSKKVKPALKV